MATIRGCLLVGSVPLPDAETAFRDAMAAMPERLKRIPDGETGVRHWFTYFQGALFGACPDMMTKFELNKMVNNEVFTSEQIDQGISKLKEKPLETGYDTAAFESYAVFKQLRSEGVIPQGVRFQVCLPTPASVIGAFIQQAFQPKVEPIYKDALHRAAQNIQASIPHEDLSIQFDLAIDTAYWEGVYLKPWFDNVKEYTIDYISRMISWVAPDVEVGIHNCYGDMEHKHWFEPTSLQAVSERGLRLLERAPHRIDYFHVPVPISALGSLDQYLAPVKELSEKLKAQGGELYLGLIHKDPEATRKMIEVAKTYVSDFGVATECGMGRTPQSDISGLFELSKQISEPVR